MLPVDERDRHMVYFRLVQKVEEMAQTSLLQV
jgi:hypothetical protein